MIDRKQICWTILLIPIFLLFGGCSAGFESSTTYDAATGKRTIVNYAPTYKSSITNICDELKLKVTGFNTKKINPITYPILRALGALGPDDMEFTLSTVVHVKNVSERPCKVNFISIRFDSGEIKKSLLKPANLIQMSLYQPTKFLGSVRNGWLIQQKSRFI